MSLNDNIGFQLTATPENMVISPRRRLRLASALVPIGLGTDAIITVTLPLTDIIGHADAIWWEWIAAQVQYTAAGNLVSVHTSLQDATAALIVPLGQATATTLSFNNSSIAMQLFNPTQLTLHDDVTAWLPAAVQPLQIAIAADIHGVAAGNGQVLLWCAYRLIRGVQDG